MGLRCSLLGHDYGDVDVEREREERGSEVVLTVREYEECTHCGDRHVVSENTEVRSISTSAGVGPRSAEPPAANPGSTDAGAFAAETDETGETDAAFIDAAEVGSDPSSARSSGPGPDARSEATGTESVDTDAETEPYDRGIAPRGADAEPRRAADTPAETSNGRTGVGAGIELPTDENGDPVTDDGEILEDDGTTTEDREYGEWPDSNDVGPPIETEADSGTDADDWPDRESEPLEDDAILLDTGTSEAPSSELESAPSSGATAGGPPAAGDEETAVDGESDADPGSGIERVDEAPTPGNEGGIPGGNGQANLHCPRCGFTAGSDRSSLRTGDICPDCRMGYLGVQPDR